MVATRFEMGERVKALDRAWMATSDSERKGRAVGSISGAVMSFFSQQFGPACRSLDQARARLEGREVQASDGVNLRFDPLVVAPGEKPVLRATWAYVDSAWGPVSLQLGAQRVELTPGRRAEIPVDLTPWLAVNTRPLDARDLKITVQVGSEKRVVRISVIRDFAGRRDRLAGAKNAIVQDLAEFVRQASQGGETDFPIAEALQTGEGLESGQKKLAEVEQFPMARYEGTVLRAAIPRNAPGSVNVVLALHGAGGSENLFFESYGAGIAMKEALKRGWVFLAPRAGAQSSQKALDWLTQVRGLKIERLWVMGHSMGGGMALASGALKPKPAAVALFAPASRSVPSDLATTPIFLAVGKQEIGMLRQGALQLRQALDGKAGFQFLESDPCEHLMIVADAVPPAYRFFDSIAKPN